MTPRGQPAPTIFSDLVARAHSCAWSTAAFAPADALARRRLRASGAPRGGGHARAWGNLVISSMGRATCAVFVAGPGNKPGILSARTPPGWPAPGAAEVLAEATRALYRSRRGDGAARGWPGLARAHPNLFIRTFQGPAAWLSQVAHARAAGRCVQPAPFNVTKFGSRRSRDAGSISDYSGGMPGNDSKGAVDTVASRHLIPLEGVTPDVVMACGRVPLFIRRCQKRQIVRPQRLLRDA